MRFFLPPALLFVVLAGCSGDKDETVADTDVEADADTDADTDTDTDTDADADTDTDADADTDTGPAYSGLLTRTGSATVSGSYVGTEEIIVVGDDGYGAVVCQITYDLTSVAERTDCTGCQWAWDVQVSNAAVVVDDLGACLGAAGVDASTVSTLDGTVRSYGYNPDYFDHSQVLVVDDGGGWATVSYASWDEGTSTFEYDWVDGVHAY